MEICKSKEIKNAQKGNELTKGIRNVISN